jgi:superfamily II DNA/RNA helicase
VQFAGRPEPEAFSCRALRLFLYFPAMSFRDFGLLDEVVQGVEAMGYSEPTPIQLRAIPLILEGKDLMGSAQTGTGKTAAFGLPLLTMLKSHSDTRCLILEPTRELAAQVETAFRDFGVSWISRWRSSRAESDSASSARS